MSAPTRTTSLSTRSTPTIREPHATIAGELALVGVAVLPAMFVDRISR